MAPRGRSLTVSEDAYSDRSNDSSPDPLAISFDENITSSPRKASPRKPMLGSSPTKPARRPEPSEMIFSSPSKSMVLSTPRGNGASPWRIKVTVQAEPEDGENAESPSVKRVTRTKTTTVPLKDPDASSPVKRPRGRPRKSETGSTPKPKRKGTPIKRPAQFSSPSKIIGGGDSSAADVDTDIPPRKRRGRPRKSVEPSNDGQNAAVGSSETTPEFTREQTPHPSAGARSGSSEKSARFTEPSRPDLQTMDDALRTSPTRSEPSPSLGTPAHSSMRNSLRERRGTPHANRVAIIESDEDDDGALTPPSGDDDNDNDDLPEVQPLSGLEDDQQDALTPSETSAQSSDSDDDASNTAGDGGAQDAQEYEDDDGDDETQGHNFTFDEGTTRMPDDTTMLDSETFSMISVESLRNNTARPTPPRPQGVQTAIAAKAGSSLRHEYLGPATHSASESERSTSEEHMSVAQANAETAPNDPERPKLSRHVTPAMDYEVPTAPPALQPVQPTPTKSPSPTLGRAVTAGVALQGLLDPNRLTPDASQKTPNAKRGSLDDLFRGFSSGTRKDLQAGLRLGEQLAQGQTEEDIAPGRSSPIRAQPTVAPKSGVFRTKRKYQQSRLLTPEDQDHVVTAAGPAVAANDVQYPTLDVEELDKTPMSPARSESAMSWQADTPQRVAENQIQRDADIEEARVDIAGPAEEEAVQHDDFGDIWQEEASRSVISTHPEEPSAEKSPEVHDLFTDASVVRPARGRVARTWRRKKVNEGTESRQEPVPERTEPNTRQSKDNEEDQRVGSARSEEQPVQAGKPNAESEESDDAGMFFHSNAPSALDQKRPARFQRRRPRRQEAEKVSLSELLDQGESFVPESSPPTTTQKTPPKKTPPKAKINPFLDTPPRFPAIMNSPKKSSPLRQELHSGDISTSSVQQFEESTLPIAQSSPFHTVVDGDSKISAASDQRQFRMEMEGNTASTIIRVREEANEYLDAYEPQERSLNDITEVTEASRTHQDISHLPSSPPKMQQRFEQRLLSARKPSPLSKTTQRSDKAPTPQPRKPLAHSKQPEVIELSSGSSSSEEPETSPSVAAQPAPQPAVTKSAKSTSRLPEPLPEPQPHPILSRMTPLPKVEPWTRTHYKALDKLYSTHLKHPALFCPFNVPPTPLSRTNGHLLRRFLAENGNLPYVGAVFHAWGYSMVMTAELVVLCSVFMELMSLRSEFEYEQVAGKKLEIGNCAPGRRGDWISGEDVLQRLATVVMGESVRRDERAGREIDRSRSLYIEWPQTTGRS